MGKAQRDQRVSQRGVRRPSATRAPRRGSTRRSSRLESQSAVTSSLGETVAISLATSRARITSSAVGRTRSPSFVPSSSRPGEGPCQSAAEASGEGAYSVTSESAKRSAASGNETPTK